jgi:oxygen-independent coproporphyrinogen-3 oxidase
MASFPLSLPPLSLYIHIPWCVKKCPYCDFNSHAAGEHLPESDYIAALTRDLDRELPYVQERKLSSIFFGGGTPSLFSANAIGEILNAVEQRIPFATDIEITLEANPGTFEQQKFCDYRRAGINRLSIGVQSFNSQHLQRLGRIHNGSEAKIAVETARAAGFENINLDLMHGLPGQTVEQALADLQQAMELAPNHVSWYQLTIEQNTEFYRSPPVLPQEDMLDDIQQHGQALLANNGFQQYEISAYAQADQQSKHNLNYWRFGDYLGIGAGAHGKITLPGEDRIIRTRKTRVPTDYLARTDSATAAKHAITEDELTLEFMMNALRLTKGVPVSYLPERTGIAVDSILPSWNALVQLGLAEPADTRLTTTPKGLLFLNTVLEHFS